MYYDPNYVEFGAPQGWVCPRCHRVMNPSAPFCYFCNGDTKTYPSTTTNPATIDISPTNGEKDWWERYLHQTTTGAPPSVPNVTNISTTYTSHVNPEMNLGWFDNMIRDYFGE